MALNKIKCINHKVVCRKKNKRIFLNIVTHILLGALTACFETKEKPSQQQNNQTTPTAETPPATYTIKPKNIAVGRSCSYIRKDDGSLWVLGRMNLFSNGELPGAYCINNIGFGFEGPIKIKNSGVKEVTATHILLDDSSVRESAWFNQVDDNASSISAFSEHILIVKKDGRLFGKGRSSHGQLGITSTTEITMRQIISGVKIASAGGLHSAVITEQGKLLTFGANFSGQLGDGTTVDRYVPVEVMTDVIQVSTGDSHTLVIKKDGSAWGFGANALGQLGDSSTSFRTTPIKIMENVKQVCAGGSSSIILTSDGKAWTLGSGNTSPQLLMTDAVECAAGPTTSIVKLNTGRYSVLGGYPITDFQLE